MLTETISINNTFLFFCGWSLEPCDGYDDEKRRLHCNNISDKELRIIVIELHLSVAERGSDRGPGKKPHRPGPHEPLLLDGDAPPTLEEIQSWGQSFDRLMRSAAGRKVFREFLRVEYSEENIMFWLACEELKRETDPDAIEEKARFIYEDYISILSPKEVSLDSRVRETVNRNMVEPTPHTFDEAQLQIYTLMHRDSYPRFVNSPLYKALTRMTAGSPAAPATTPAAPADAAATATDAQ
ncbi:unnamed protein product [Parnassius mnemosyne]|uniref:RGS domain-containing protein n=1 Tax=Parnassius mnemosyne TaxID=213953 RepID=A0AAV1KKT7_9NEOP